jgi:hypothetical protein
MIAIGLAPLTGAKTAPPFVMPSLVWTCTSSSVTFGAVCFLVATVWRAGRNPVAATARITIAIGRRCAMNVGHLIRFYSSATMDRS